MQHHPIDALQITIDVRFANKFLFERLSYWLLVVVEKLIDTCVNSRRCCLRKSCKGVIQLNHIGQRTRVRTNNAIEMPLPHHYLAQCRISSHWSSIPCIVCSHHRIRMAVFNRHTEGDSIVLMEEARIEV